MAKQLKGKLDISGTMSGSMDDGSSARDFVSITLIDDASFCEVLEIVVDKRAFADALFGQAHVPCAFVLRANCPVGKTRQTKTEVVPVPDDATAANIRQAVAAFEVDGWKGRDRDASNMHCYAGWNGKSRCFNVTFTRFVAEPDQPVVG